MLSELGLNAFSLSSIYSAAEGTQHYFHMASTSHPPPPKNYVLMSVPTSYRALTSTTDDEKKPKCNQGSRRKGKTSLGSKIIEACHMKVTAFKPSLIFSHHLNTTSRFNTSAFCILRSLSVNV